MTLSPPAPRVDRTPDAEALFYEARRRRAQIRAAAAGIAASALVVGAALFAVWAGGPGAGSRTPPARAWNAATDPAPARSIVWVDYANRLRLGDLGAGTEKRLATVEASPLVPLVVSAGRVYVVDTAGTFVRSLGHWSEVLDAVNLSTGSVRTVAPGDGVFPAPDAEHLFVPQAGDQSVLEIATKGRASAVTLNLPRGWYLPSGAGVAVGHDIVVQSNDSGTVLRPDAIGLWDLRTGRVVVLARSADDYTSASPDSGILGASTAPDGRGGVLAWMRPSCRASTPCPLELTDLETMRTVTVNSPLGHGFAPGGAVSPDGRVVALFALVSPGPGGVEAEAAFVDTSTGTVHVAPRARVELGQVAAWAAWLPGAKEALAGTASQTYAVALPSLRSRPVTFRVHGATLEPDFSTAVAPT